MSVKWWGAMLCFSLLCIPMSVWACYYGNLDQRSLPDLIADAGEFVQDVDAKETPELQRLIRTLRGRGQVAVDGLLAHRTTWGTRPGEVDTPEVKQRLDDLIDRVAGQKYASESKLFWNTTLRAAKVRSANSGKPILSLRMLGRLDQEFSCANSRFFRLMLYPDPAIAKQLRENFVLHWEPVRQVPKVTIDFGDGRVLQRPLTGNSVHLVLDELGTPIDALPGLVSPAEFARWLGDVGSLWQDISRTSKADRWSKIAEYHRARAAQARQASALAIQQGQSVQDLNLLDRRWIDASSKFQAAVLSPVSTRLVSKLIPAEVAMPITRSKSIVETPLLAMVRDVNNNVARDTAFNLYGLRPKIDDWFSDATDSSAFTYASLTDRIYAEVFLMPLNDPWLGLSPDEHFVALPNSGRFVTPASSSTQQQQTLDQIRLGLNR